MNKINIIGFLLLILISSCRKDINEINEILTIDGPTILNYTPNVENIIGSLIGQVVDENNQPMTDIKIKMNGEDYYTNAFGHFIINDITMNSKGQLVQAFQNATHFQGSRRFFPQEGAISRVKIQMIKKEFTDEFSAQENAEVLIEGGAKVNFEPNSIKDSDGNIYQGVVMVASHYLDPLARETFDKMPGNLQGVNQLTEEVALQTYGMIAVELETPNGEKLNIADGKTATISMPVPDDLLAIAPSQIPLWSYFEDYGLWGEESTATLQNNVYVGNVSHFSFWNCDYPYPLVGLDVTFTDNVGNPLVGNWVKIELENGATCSGYTDNNGTIAGLFPANEILTFSVLGECNDIIFAQDFGPYSSDTSIGSIAILLPTVNNTVIKGTLRDCDNNLIDNGLVIVNMNGYLSYFYVGSGPFEILITACDNVYEMEVYGINVDNLEQSATVTALSNEVNELGDLVVCGVAGLQNYIRVVYNSDTIYLFVDAGSYTDGDWTYIQSIGNNVGAVLYFKGLTTGDYSDSNSNFVESIYNQNTGMDLQPINSSMSGFTSFIVTQYDTKLIGTFGGEALNGAAQVQIQGDFNINL